MNYPKHCPDLRTGILGRVGVIDDLSPDLQNQKEFRNNCRNPGSVFFCGTDVSQCATFAGVVLTEDSN